MHRYNQSNTLATTTLLRDIGNILDNENVKATVYSSVKAGTCVGIATILGGIFGGPRGLVVGASLAGLVASQCTAGTFKPISVVFQELTPAQREKIANAIRNFFTRERIFSVLQLVQSEEVLIPTLIQTIAPVLLSYGYSIS